MTSDTAPHRSGICSCQEQNSRHTGRSGRSFLTHPLAPEPRKLPSWVVIPIAGTGAVIMDEEGVKQMSAFSEAQTGMYS
jgi:hypothetical protein